MTDARFELCLPLILKEEGGYSNVPADPGGPTNFGITIIDYRKYVKPDATAADVRAMTVDQTKPIYYSHYWLPICPHLVPGVDLMFFNIAVNGGVRRAAVILQRALNIPEDSDEFKSGHETVGPVTLAYAAKADPRKLINDFDALVVAFYRGLSTFPVFGDGWLAREARIHTAALKVAPSPTQPTAPAPTTPAPKETTPMATTAVAPVTITDPIPQIIAFLELAKKYLPMVVGFIPAPFGAVATAAVPIVEEVLQLIEDAKTKSGIDLFQTIGAHIEAIGQKVQSTAATAAQVTVTPAAPTPGMPNS